MNYKLFISVLTFCCSLAIFAQTPPQRNCGTMQHHNYLKLNRPSYETDLNNYNVMIEQYLAAQQTGTSATSRTSAAIVIAICELYLEESAKVKYRGLAESAPTADAL